MEDKTLMEDILLQVKGACDLYLHGSIESSTQNVHSAFDCALNDTLKMQNEIYTKMSEKGWYAPEQAQQQKLDQTKQQFASGC